MSLDFEMRFWWAGDLYLQGLSPPVSLNLGNPCLTGQFQTVYIEDGQFVHKHEVGTKT